MDKIRQRIYNLRYELSLCTEEDACNRIQIQIDALCSDLILLKLQNNIPVMVKGRHLIRIHSLTNFYTYIMDETDIDYISADEDTITIHYS